jgi:hypothetical protein
MCHTRVMADGSVVKGAQGNVPINRAIALSLRTAPLPEEALKSERELIQGFFAMPWLQPDPLLGLERLSLDALASVYEAIPPGVMPRFGTSLFYPVQVPDLIGIKDRRYLDHTGLGRHRHIGDLMRYAAINTGGDALSRYAGFRPAELLFGGTLPDPAMLERHSDEQLYALALYIYSLRPPPNPNRFTARAARGQKVFEREGCGGCHTPPLYTNNRLTIAPGFKPPEDHFGKYDILNVSVGVRSGPPA